MDRANTVTMSEEMIQAGLTAHQNGQFQAAEDHYRQVLSSDPSNVRVLYLLGSLLTQTSRSEQAIPMLRQAAALLPNRAEIFASLGIGYHNCGETRAAIDAYRHAIQIQPNHGDALYNLGAALHEMGQFEDAIHAYRSAIQSRPDFAKAWNNLGITLNHLGHTEQAIAAFRQAIAIDENYVEACYNLANVYKASDRFDEALYAYQQAIQQRSSFSDAYFELGAIYERLRDHQAAVAFYQQALQVNLSSAETLWALIHQRQHLADWSGLEEQAHDALLKLDGLLTRPDLDFPAPLCIVAAVVETSLEQQRVAAIQRCRAPTIKLARYEHRYSHARHTSGTGQRIRIGYLSSDLHQHPVGLFMAPTFEFHDREQFEVFAYAYGPNDASITRTRICRAVEHFRDVASLNSAAIAQKIYDDQLDLLVDLNGHTQNARLKILAFRPAPVQMHYLGYPGTTGGCGSDFLIADQFVIPVESQHFYTERIVYVDGCFLPGTRPTHMDLVDVSRDHEQLPEGRFIFGAFHAVFKITPSMFATWMRILQRVPNSVLWLNASHPVACQNLELQAERLGIARQRLIFAPFCDYARHQSRLRLANLFLDTFPYNAHTTASDVLQAKVPLITLTGSTFASRVAGSMLHALGMDALICQNLADYEEMAVHLATHPDQLHAMNEHLARSVDNSSQFDGNLSARKLEQTYRDVLAKTGKPLLQT